MKLIIIFIFFIEILCASENSNNIRTKILEGVVSKISMNKKTIVWSDNNMLLSKFKSRAVILTSTTCNDASLIIIQNKKNIPEICRDKPSFVLEYNLLSDIPQSFGALFWKKGRPNIVIIEPRIKSQSIKVSKDLQNYLEEQIW